MICKHCGKFSIYNKCLYCGHSLGGEKIAETKQYEPERIPEHIAEEISQEDTGVKQTLWNGSKEVINAWKKESIVPKIVIGIRTISILIMLFGLYLVEANIINASGTFQLPLPFDLNFERYNGVEILKYFSEEGSWYITLIWAMYFLPLSFSVAANNYYMIDLAKWVTKNDVDYRSIINNEQTGFSNKRAAAILGYAGLIKDNRVAKTLFYARMAYVIVFGLISTLLLHYALQSSLNIAYNIIISGASNIQARDIIIKILINKETIILYAALIIEILISFPIDIALMIKRKRNLKNQ